MAPLCCHGDCHLPAGDLGLGVTRWGGGTGCCWTCGWCWRSTRPCSSSRDWDRGGISSVPIWHLRAVALAFHWCPKFNSEEKGWPVLLVVGGGSLPHPYFPWPGSSASSYSQELDLKHTLPLPQGEVLHVIINDWSFWSSPSGV